MLIQLKAKTPVLPPKYRPYKNARGRSPRRQSTKNSTGDERPVEFVRNVRQALLAGKSKQLFCAPVSFKFGNDSKSKSS